MYNVGLTLISYNRVRGIRVSAPFSFTYRFVFVSTFTGSLKGISSVWSTAGRVLWTVGEDNIKK